MLNSKYKTEVFLLKENYYKCYYNDDMSIVKNIMDEPEFLNN